MRRLTIDYGNGFISLSPNVSISDALKQLSWYEDLFGAAMSSMPKRIVRRLLKITARKETDKIAGEHKRKKG